MLFLAAFLGCYGSPNFLVIALDPHRLFEHGTLTR
jgi:hypothetical protein